MWIGPRWSVIRDMGDKVGARRLMAAAGVPVVPGSEGVVETVDAARDAGRPRRLPRDGEGRRRRWRHRHGARGPRRRLAKAFEEHRSKPGGLRDRGVFVERFVESPRHIEVQVMGEGPGTIVHLRRARPLDPAPTPEADRGVAGAGPGGRRPKQTPDRVGPRAARAAVGYTNAGTMEFIDTRREFDFLEMNTRMQVEHTMTEEVTGVDLVQAQLRVASGEALPWTQDAIVQRGASIECRIYAEDPGEELPAVAGPPHESSRCQRGRASDSSAGSRRASRCRCTTIRSSPS